MNPSKTLMFLFDLLTYFNKSGIWWFRINFYLCILDTLTKQKNKHYENYTLSTPEKVNSRNTQRPFCWLSSLYALPFWN